MDYAVHKDIIHYWFGLRFPDHQRMIDNAKPDERTLGHGYRSEWVNRFIKDGLDAICQMDNDSRDLFFYVLKRYYYDKARVGDSFFGKDYPKVTQEEVLKQIRSDHK